MSAPLDEFILKVNDLTITFAERSGQAFVALENVNLSVNPGEILCLLGPSGCGKTTLLKALGGFIVPSRGSILFHQRELPGITKDIVLIFQEHNLYPWLTVAENIAFGPRMVGMPKSERKSLVERMMDIAGLTEASARYPHQLSGGMRQRVAIMRALAAQPEVLLLDEPFSALDVNLRRRLQRFLLEVWEETGMTMIMVTHNIEEAIRVGQKVVVMGGSSSNIIHYFDTAEADYQDRYSSRFLSLQSRLEEIMEGRETDDSDAASAATAG